MKSLFSTLIALCVGAALGPLLAIGAIAHGGAPTVPGSGRPGGAEASSSPSIAYVREVNAALLRYDLARGEGDRLLTERDADPRLAVGVEWRQNFERVVQEHHLVHVKVQSLHAPLGADAIQQCLVDGLRLTATGESLLFEAFGADGHRAYYLSAHGNWDLNLGVRAVARCRASLTLIPA